ncbi:HAD hydrolase-like protein [Ornithinimicrobium sp. INDO-MA30-4]|uniref:HAD hydrolase-like protein n=1 Tax=Ornithinimicrobium sp. INDO-MA30-4 TaxID=2908651 RepID=UPI001F27BB6F|nr:HAD hydrolase-like protein [Ornithinimicrobium sp. INDO-MA30-4]UJH70485.1 hypothetical protein L0A91_15560 [Ornithinimicrobium sp. INDO-MA30-4]
MSAELVLFDLDGTLTDSAPGIISSLKLALADLGLPAPDDGVLFGLLGPPFGSVCRPLACLKSE